MDRSDVQMTPEAPIEIVINIVACGLVNDKDPLPETGEEEIVHQKILEKATTTKKTKIALDAMVKAKIEIGTQLQRLPL